MPSSRARPAADQAVVPPSSTCTFGSPIWRYQDAVAVARTTSSQQNTMAPSRTPTTSSVRCTACPPGNHQNPGTWPSRYSSSVRTSMAYTGSRSPPVHDLARLRHGHVPHAILRSDPPGELPRPGQPLGRRLQERLAVRPRPPTPTPPAPSRDVPLRRSYTRGNPMRCSVRAPMMLRVRPAQLTTMVASSCPRRMSWMRQGQLRAGSASTPGDAETPVLLRRAPCPGSPACRPASGVHAAPPPSSPAPGAPPRPRSPNSLLNTFIPHSVA